MGFEPTRAEPIGLAVQRLNHSATSSSWCSQTFGHNCPNACLASWLTWSGWGIRGLPPKQEEEKFASAGNRTRINCLEGSYADHYTTDATLPV